MSPSPGRPVHVAASDEWFADFIRELEGSKVRRRRLWRERVVLPVKAELARKYEMETEMYRRMIRVESARWKAERKSA